MKKSKLFLCFAALCAVAAAVYLFRNQLKSLPLFNRFLAGDESEAEEDLLSEYEETMVRSAGEETSDGLKDAGTDFIEDQKDKEEKSSKNKIRRGYTEIHFHKEAAAEGTSE